MGVARKTIGPETERPAPAILSGIQVEFGGDENRLLIVSDIRFLREGLAEILARDDVFVITGMAAGLDEALAQWRANEPQIVLLDATLPDGLRVARHLRALSPNVPIVALALAETEAEVIAWAEAGISGYVPRSAGLGDLVKYLRDIVHGEQICATRVAAGLLRWISAYARAGSEARPRGKLPVLTAREDQVVQLISSGLSNKEISRRLNIGLATTKSHVHNLLAKLELERRGQVVRWSRDHPGVLRDNP
jgi:two-component system, NarL family, nitrate/nitrite response regulator NarL